MEKSETSEKNAVQCLSAGGRSCYGKNGRDLLNAPTLRPSEVYVLYGMPATTVSDLCSHSDPEKRIASYKLPGRQGRKGSRYIDHAAFKTWLLKWRAPEDES